MSENSKKILITGGAGFIGSSLARGLVRLGYNVTILDALLPQFGGNMFNLSSIEDKITFVNGDIRDRETIDLLGSKFDYVFHFAAQVGCYGSTIAPALDVDINIRGGINILEACKRWPGVTVVFSSSRIVYGMQTESPVSEQATPHPISMYANNKLLFERYLEIYRQNYGIDYVVCRFTNPYGPRQQIKHAQYGILNWFIRLACENKDLTVFGEGNQIRDYIYIDDITDALRKIIEQNVKNEVINIGFGRPVRFIDMAKAVVAETKRSKVVSVPWPDVNKKNETGDFYADVSKASKLLGWQAVVTLEEGIARTYDYYREHLSKYV